MWKWNSSQCHVSTSRGERDLPIVAIHWCIETSVRGSTQSETIFFHLHRVWRGIYVDSMWRGYSSSLNTLMVRKVGSSYGCDILPIFGIGGTLICSQRIHLKVSFGWCFRRSFKFRFQFSRQYWLVSRWECLSPKFVAKARWYCCGRVSEEAHWKSEGNA